MKGLLIFVLCCFYYSSVQAGEWGIIKKVSTGYSVVITYSSSELGLIWQDSIVPGEDLLLTNDVDSSLKTTFFHTYTFVGVISDSAQINIKGAIKENGSASARESESMTKTIFVERNKDGSFYFVPSNLKNEGYFTIKYNPEFPGVYSILLKRFSN